MKVIKGNFYRVKKITDQQKDDMGIPSPFYPENQIVQVTSFDPLDGWCGIRCKDGAGWLMKEEYLLETCIWEVL